MKKPVWLRLVGWVDLALCLLCAVLLVAGLTTPAVAIPAISLTYIFAPPAFALFCLWAIVSGIVWSATKSVRIQAAVTRDVVGQALAARSAPVELPTARTGIVCAKCGNYSAVLHCNRHKESVCWRCAVKTDTPECAYILANRKVRIGELQLNRTVRTSPLSVTSPLSGIR